MSLTVAELHLLAPRCHNPEVWQPVLDAAMQKYEIDSGNRRAFFLANILHESMELSHTEENLNYSAAALLATWPKHFDADGAAWCAHRPDAIANRAYANRMGNGPEASGDGWRFRGRGLLQVTGRSGYAAAAAALGLDCLADPALLAEPEGACLSAAEFFARTGCRELADAGDFNGVVEKINGGLLGLDSRLRYLGECSRILVPAVAPAPAPAPPAPAEVIA